MTNDFLVGSRDAYRALVGFVNTDEEVGGTRDVSTDAPLPVTIMDPLPLEAEITGFATETTLELVSQLLNNVLTAVSPPSVLGNGDSLTVGDTEVPEPLTTEPTSTRSVYIRARSDNDGFIGWGGENVAGGGGDGPRLNPGDEVWIPIDDASKVYVSVSVAGDGVYWSYVA